jgi:hypothetical protein
MSINDDTTALMIFRARRLVTNDGKDFYEVAKSTGMSESQLLNAIKASGGSPRLTPSEIKTIEDKAGLKIGDEPFLYLYVKVGNQWVMNCRLVWEKEYWKIPEGWSPHHLDEDKYNDEISNLIVMQRHVHDRLHHNGLKSEHSIKVIDHYFTIAKLKKYISERQKLIDTLIDNIIVETDNGIRVSWQRLLAELENEKALLEAKCNVLETEYVKDTDKDDPYPYKKRYNYKKGYYRKGY